MTYGRSMAALCIVWGTIWANNGCVYQPAGCLFMLHKHYATSQKFVDSCLLQFPEQTGNSQDIISWQKESGYRLSTLLLVVVLPSHVFFM